jgi:hypothetical protein
MSKDKENKEEQGPGEVTAKVTGSAKDVLQMAARSGAGGVKVELEGDEKKLNEQIDKVTVPETMENTTLRAAQVPPGTQMAPNLINRDALPNDDLDKLRRSANAQAPDAAYRELKRKAHEENEEQIERMLQIDRNAAEKRSGPLKEEKPSADKTDKSASNRSTK